MKNMKEKQKNSAPIIEATEESVKSLIQNFSLSKQQLIETQERVLKNSKTTFDFVLRTIFSVLLIILGMIIDSPAVVIGGMIVAPLFWPLLGFAFGVIEGNPKIFTQTLFTLVKSIIISVGIAVVVGIFAPPQILESNEFLSRTAPTVYDLLIGIASGFLGAYIVTHPKISSTFAGVAISAAVAPPIVAMGIALSKGDFDTLGGTFLLMVSSLVSMVFAASVLFYFAHARRRDAKKFFEEQKEKIVWITVSLFIVLVPLILLTNQIITQTQQKNVVTQIIETQIPGAHLQTIEITERDHIVNVRALIQKNDEITEKELQTLTRSISNELRQSIALNVQQVPLIEKTQIYNY